MLIAGLQKLTLLDFPGRTACTLFTYGCNFRCPFCHNSSLVRPGDAFEPEYSEDEILDFLKGRRGKLDGICITGGEPLLQKGLEEFMEKIKNEGFLIKLDTNGSFPDRLKGIMERKLCDYIAMDIKNIPEKYGLSAGASVDIAGVKRSVELLKNGSVDYEFRTTVVKELNDMEDFQAIALWLKGSKRYFLQKFKDSGEILMPGYSAYDDGDMHKILDIVKGSGLENVWLRGVD